MTEAMSVATYRQLRASMTRYRNKYELYTSSLQDTYYLGWTENAGVDIDGVDKSGGGHCRSGHCRSRHCRSGKCRSGQ